ncbi:MAG: hypothetical protein HY752_02310 [Nitrospirae bacterium]|nr:hypothetical protein [Nitrospirota bacterium]
MRKFLISIILLFILWGCSKPSPSDIAVGEIDALGEPQQIAVTEDKEPIAIDLENGKFYLKPVAGYSISAVVVSKKSYSYGWQAKLALVDLALAWGKLSDPETRKHFKFTQSDRWYYFEYENDSPLDVSYISTHSSNNHIIPANENIRLAIKSLKKNDTVTLEGFLINAAGKYKGTDLWWNSSLTRNDSGDSSCEVFYVTKVRNGDYIYE